MQQILDRLPVDKITPDPDNPRSGIDKHTLNELARSIAYGGLLQPVVVKPVSGGNQIKFGHRRHAAIALINDTPDLLAIAQEHGHADKQMLVTVIIDSDNTLTENDMLTTLLQQIAENDQREDLSPIDEAMAFRRAVDVGGITQKDLAARIGKTPGHVSKRLSLLTLPDEVKSLVEDGSMPLEVAYEMSRVDDPLGEGDLAWIIDEVKQGYQPDLDEVRSGVEQALKIQTEAKAVVKFADTLEKKNLGVPVVGSVTELPPVEGFVYNFGSEFGPDKIPAKQPKNAAGIVVLGSDRARWVVSEEENDQKPIDPELAKATAKAAKSGDTAAIEAAAAAEKKAKQARRDLLARVRDERLHRLQFLSTVAHKANKTSVADLALRYVAEHEVTAENRQRVAEIIGLDPVLSEEPVTEWRDGKNVKTGKVRTVKHWDKAIAEFLDDEKNAERNLKVLAAAVLITKGESVLAEASPGFEFNYRATDWGYPTLLESFDFKPLPEPEPEKPAELPLDGKVSGGKKAAPAKAAAKKAPAKKAAASKKAPLKIA